MRFPTRLTSPRSRNGVRYYDTAQQSLVGRRPCEPSMTIKLFIISLLIFIACMFSSFVTADAATLRTFNSHDVAGKAKGVGSLPSVILHDGTVCGIDKAHPS